MRTLIPGVVLLLAVAGPLRADETTLPPKIQALSVVTGDAALKAQAEQLLAQPEATKKLIAEALTLVKKKQTLPYTAAFLLAYAATEFKDVPAGEAFYRVCMADASKLHSRSKILASYGGLIDLYFNNKKYAESARVCQELIDLKLDDGKPRFYLAEFDDPVKGKIFEEVENYDPLRSLRPGVHRLRIQAIAKQGKYDQALKLVENLVRNDDHW